mmetsp:Transcript_48195/g.71425  ORF Transcript_48195/g.71425 Transcript_48195/m.71425 type:complete len:442 (-) Transcript_48195:954-2279(-)
MVEDINASISWTRVVNTLFFGVLLAPADHRVLAQSTPLNITSCDVQSAEELHLEESMDTLEMEFLNATSQANQTQDDYIQFQNIYYDKDSSANETYNELVLYEKDVELKGNNTIDDYDALISVYNAIQFDEDAYNNSINSLKSSYELMLLQNETYTQSLIDGDPNEIQEAEDALNQTFTDFVNTAITLNASDSVYSVFVDQLKSIDSPLQVASTSLQQYSDSLSLLEHLSLAYDTKLLEASAAENVSKAKELEVQSAWNVTSEKLQEWHNALDALELERDDLLQTCLSEIDSSNSSRLLRRRMQVAICNCTPEEMIVAIAEGIVEVAEQDIATTEGDIASKSAWIEQLEIAKERDEQAYRDGRFDVLKAEGQQLIALINLNTATTNVDSAKDALDSAMDAHHLAGVGLIGASWGFLGRSYCCSICRCSLSLYSRSSIRKDR